LVQYESSGYGAKYRTDSHANDYIGFGISPIGYGERLTKRDSSVVSLWGTYHMWANSCVRDYEQIGSGRALTLFVPRHALKAVGARAVDSLDLVSDLDTPTMRILRVMLQALRREGEALDGGEAVALRNSLLELTSRVAEHRDMPTETAAVSAAMRQSIVTWIGTRVHLGPVSPIEAAAAHGISVRSLHRLFEGGGSFSALVRSARLSRARQDVIDTTDLLQTIAVRWGFSDASHLCREFRKAYGSSPRELRMEFAPIRDQE
jgi:AraC-like DNA-binding protein